MENPEIRKEFRKGWRKKFLHYFEFFKTISLISVILLAFLLVIELGFPFFARPFSDYELDLLHEIELIAIAILAVEVAVDLYISADRITYLKHNWLLILSLLPFASSVRIFRAAQSSRLAARIGNILKIARTEGSTTLKGLKVSLNEGRISAFFRALRVSVIFGRKKPEKRGAKKRKKHIKLNKK